MARLLNTSDLRMPFGHKKQHTLVLPQKRQACGGDYLMMPLFDNRELMIFLSRKELAQLHRHIGGMLALEEK